MRTEMWLVVVILATESCSPQGVGCGTPADQARLAELEASVGARFADRYFTFWRMPLDSCEAQIRRAMYIGEFFEGYRAPKAVIFGDDNAELRAMQAGMRAGQEYRRSSPDSVAATYASFGYAAISIEGVWTTGFEHSGFVPAQGYEGETWWLQSLPELSARLRADFVPKQGRSVRIKGYVSNDGRHGHLGAYQRLVYVEEATSLGY